MNDFARYHQHTEELVCWLASRMEEDEVLHRALSPGDTWRPGLLWVMDWDSLRGWRTCVRRAFARPPGAWRSFWLVVARHHAWCIRLAAEKYRHRADFNPAWLHPPQ